MRRPEAARAAAPLAKTRLRLWLRLLKLTRGIETELRERLRQDFDTTLPRFDVMSALHRSPDGLKMSEISGRLKVSNGNVTGIVDRLVAEALVIREAMPGDRRAARVRLTRRGAEDFARQAAAHQGWIDAALGRFDAADAAEMIRLLDATPAVPGAGAEGNR